MKYVIMQTVLICWISGLITSSVAGQRSETDTESHDSLSTDEANPAEFELLPEQVGFAKQEIETSVGKVEIYVSTEGQSLDSSRKLPLLFFLQGSGPTPIYYGTKDQLGTSLVYDPSEISGFHFVIAGKPDIPFFSSESTIKSTEYDQRLSLPFRIAVAREVLAHCVQQDWCDADRVLVVGHSEGADVAPWVGLDHDGDPALASHIAVLAPGGVSQMFDYLLFARRRAATGEIPHEQADREIEELYRDFRMIFEDPNATDKFWQGHTYLRWSTFLKPAMEAYRELELPVYIATMRDDRNTPVQSGEAIQLEMIRLGKQNVNYRLWPADHYLVEETESGPIDRRMDVMQDILRWTKFFD